MINVKILASGSYYKLRSRAEKVYLNSVHKEKGFRLEKIEIGIGDYEPSLSFVEDNSKFIDHSNKSHLVNRLQEIQEDPKLSLQFEEISFDEIINYLNSLIPIYIESKDRCAELLLLRISFINTLHIEGINLSTLMHERIEVLDKRIMNLDFDMSELDYDELKVLKIYCIDSSFDYDKNNDVIGGSCKYYCQLKKPLEISKPREVFSNRNFGIIIFLLLINNGWEYKAGNSGKKGSHQSMFDDLINNINDYKLVSEMLPEFNLSNNEDVLNTIHRILNNGLYRLPNPADYKGYFNPKKIFGFHRNNVFNEKMPDLLLEQLKLFGIEHDNFVSDPKSFLRHFVPLKIK